MDEIKKPLNSHQFDENMYAVENPTVKATYFVQDPLLPFQFVETTINGQLKTTSMLPSSVANYRKEDDTIRVFLTMMSTTAF